MLRLRNEIRSCNDTGIFASDLTDEDTEDFIAYLQKEKIPALMLYRIDYPITSGNSYDGYEIEEVGLGCVANFILDDPTRIFLEKIDECTEVGPFGGYEGQLEEDRTEIERNTRVINRYTKRVAKALRDFSEAGVVLDQDNLASEMMGEFFPRYSNSNDTVSEEDKIMLDKVSTSLIRRMRMTKFRENSFGRVVLEEFFANGKDEIDYDWVLKRVKNNGFGSDTEKIKSDCNYFNSKLKKELGLDYDAASPDNNLRRVVINPIFRKMVKVIE